jgi:phosphoglycerate dehydrogenase-like enzyme
VVSLHLPCTPETTNLINAQTLAKMKRGAILINTARGGLVDEDALVEALRTRHLAAAALDVFRVEPLPVESPLAQLDSALLCPHTGGTDEESMALMAQLAAESIVDLYHGRWPQGRVVNEEIRPGWKW